MPQTLNWTDIDSGLLRGTLVSLPPRKSPRHAVRCPPANTRRAKVLKSHMASSRRVVFVFSNKLKLGSVLWRSLLFWAPLMPVWRPQDQAQGGIDPEIPGKLDCIVAQFSLRAPVMW